jgi:adenine-specific DNA methylase
MPHNWWTRRPLVFMLALISLACVVALVAAGLTSPEPIHSAALGPQWQCSRLAFVFTICSRVSEIESAIVRVARQPACRRPRA